MKVLFTLLFSMSTLWSFAQATSGTTGLLNIPTAEMQEDGTFIAGANYLPEAFTPARFSYNTGNYYFNITFLPFLEVTYRLTLIKSKLSEGKYSEQDRSFALRLRLWKEKKYLPALVIGGNDFYTHVSGEGNKYFGSVYAVATKSVNWKGNRLESTLGFGLENLNRGQLDGIWGGISFTPEFCKPLSLMADYDTQAVNMGASVLLFKHLYLHTFYHDFSNVVAGFSYRIQLY